MYYLNKSNAQKFVSLWLVICTCNFQPNSDHYFYIHQILLLKLKQNIWWLFWYFKKLLNILLFSVTMCCSKFVAIFTWPTYYIKIISRQFIHSPMMTMEDGMPMAVPDWASKLWQLRGAQPMYLSWVRDAMLHWHCTAENCCAIIA